MKSTSAAVYEVLAIAIAVCESITLVGSPGEPGCKIGTSNIAEEGSKSPKKILETAVME